MKAPHDPDRVAIGARIAALRKQKGLSQAELALKVGVTTSAVGQWESGHTRPAMTIMRLLAHELDVRMEYILTGEEQGDDVTAKTDMELEFLMLARRMTRRQRAAFLHQMWEAVAEDGDGETVREARKVNA